MEINDIMTLKISDYYDKKLVSDANHHRIEDIFRKILSSHNYFIIFITNGKDKFDSLEKEIENTMTENKELFDKGIVYINIKNKINPSERSNK